jgi:hypothetical protein
VHDNLTQSQIQAGQQIPVDADDPEQWQPEGLQDPEPCDDFYPQDTHGGRLPSEEPLHVDRVMKRNRSGTIDRSSLVKAEYRPFPNAAKVIRKGAPIPWEVHVSFNNFVEYTLSNM